MANCDDHPIRCDYFTDFKQLASLRRFDVIKQHDVVLHFRLDAAVEHTQASVLGNPRKSVVAARDFQQPGLTVFLYEVILY